MKKEVRIISAIVVAVGVYLLAWLYGFGMAGRLISAVIAFAFGWFGAKKLEEMKSGAKGKKI